MNRGFVGGGRVDGGRVDGGHVDEDRMDGERLGGRLCSLLRWGAEGIVVLDINEP